jgi:hypothetical protein
MRWSPGVLAAAVFLALGCAGTRNGDDDAATGPPSVTNGQQVSSPSATTAEPSQTESEPVTTPAPTVDGTTPPQDGKDLTVYASTVESSSCADGLSPLLQTQQWEALRERLACVFANPEAVSPDVLDQAQRLDAIAATELEAVTDDVGGGVVVEDDGG